MSNRKAIALNTISQVAGKIITSGTTFIVSILLARMLGAEGYGDFTKITTFVAFFYLFADFGLNAAYLEVSEEKFTQNALLTIRTIMGIALAFLCISILVFLPGSATQGYTPFVKLGIIIYSGSIFFQSLITTANAIFQKHLRYELASYALTVGSLITLITISVLPIVSFSGVIPSVIGLLLGSAVTATTALFFAKKIIPSLSFSTYLPHIKKIWIIALPLGFTLLSNAIYFHVDSVILTLTRSTVEVGIYGFAYKLFELPLVIPTFFMNTIFPLLLMSRKNGDMTAFWRQAKQAAAILFSLSLVGLVCGIAAAPFVGIIKSDFQASTIPLRILCIGLPIYYLTSVTMWVLIALKKRIHLLVIYSTSMIINIVSNIIFVPSYGYMAAAWITVASEVFVLLLSFITIQRNFNSPEK